VVKFTSATVSWTLSGTITAKYLIFYVDGATNKDLLMVADLDDTGGSATYGAGTLAFIPDGSNGWARYTQ
jgi:hypothetical protein